MLNTTANLDETTRPDRGVDLQQVPSGNAPGRVVPSSEATLFDLQHFDGETYEAEHDHARLGKNLNAVLALMRDGCWRTLSEIREAIGAGSEAGVSARLRDLRKPKFGGFTVDRRRRGAAADGLYEYRMIVNGEVQQ